MISQYDAMPFLCYLVIIFLTTGGYKDGLSERARENDSEPDGRRVGYVPWHLWGLLGRIVPQLIVWMIGMRFIDALWIDVLYTLIAAATALFGHLYLYDHATKNRDRWLWGQKIPGFMEAWNKFWKDRLGIE